MVYTKDCEAADNIRKTNCYSYINDVARPLSYKTKTTCFFKTKTKTGQVKTKIKTNFF